MASEVEKLRNEVSTLQQKGAELQRRHTEASQQKAAFEGRRQEALSRIAEGDDAARRDLRSLNANMQDAQENEQAFAVAGKKVADQLSAAKESLARAEREAAITSLQDQVDAFGPLDNAVEAALADLKAKSAALFAAVSGVADQLRAMDEKRFDGRYGYNLTSLVKESIHHRFEEMGFPNAEKRPTFLERAKPNLERAIAQLRYESLQGQVVPAKKEKLYRAVGRIRGLRGLDLRNGCLIGLRDDEAAEFLAGGSLELVEQPDIGTPLGCAFTGGCRTNKGGINGERELAGLVDVSC